MKNNLAPSSGTIPGMPRKKWYEQEERWDLFVTVPLHVVREQIVNVTATGNIREKKIWNRPVSCTGKITGNFLDITVRIGVGRGYSSYHVFGELVGDSNGCLIQVTVRDTVTFETALALGGVIIFAVIAGAASKGVIAAIRLGLFAAPFLGIFGIVLVLIQRKSGMNALKKKIREMVEKPVRM